MVLDIPDTFWVKLNKAVFTWFHSLSHRMPWIDAGVIFTAEYLLGVLVFFFLYTLYKHWNDVRRKEILILLPGVTVAAWCIARVIKTFFSTIRPFYQMSIEPLFIPNGMAAFPSGHTTALFAFATVLYGYDKPLGVAAYFIAIMTGMARVIAGVHWPADILGGALIGVLGALILTRVGRWLLKNEENARV